MRYLDPIMIRRMKNEITDFKGQGIFSLTEKSHYTIDIDFTLEEEEFYDSVGYYVNKYYRTAAADRKKSKCSISSVILHRMVSSSIYAGLQALKNRKNRSVGTFHRNKR